MFSPVKFWKQISPDRRINIVAVVAFLSALVVLLQFYIHDLHPRIFPPPNVEITLEKWSCDATTVEDGGYKYLIVVTIGLGSRKGELFEVDSVWAETQIGRARFGRHGLTTGHFRPPIVELWKGSFSLTSERKVKKIKGKIIAATNWGFGSRKFKIEKISWY